MVQDENEFYRGVYFSPEYHCLFKKNANDNSNSGIEIKQFKLWDNNNDAIVNDIT